MASIIAAATSAVYDIVLVAPAAYVILHVATWKRLVARSGAALNPILGETAKNLLIFTLLLLLAACIF